MRPHIAVNFANMISFSICKSGAIIQPKNRVCLICHIGGEVYSKILPRDQIWLEAQIWLRGILLGSSLPQTLLYIKMIPTCQIDTLVFLYLNSFHVSCFFSNLSVTETKTATKNCTTS